MDTPAASEQAPSTLDELIAHYEGVLSALKAAKAEIASKAALRATLLQIDSLIDEENL